MIKHVIIWTLDSNLSVNEKNEVRANAKRELEALVGKVPGLLKMNIEISPLKTSNADMMLYSEFEDEESLIGYKDHPEHVRVADTFLRPFTVQRSCMDFTA